MAELLVSPVLEAAAHGFSTRDTQAVDAVLPGAPVVRARQVHSAQARVVTGPWPGAEPEADALVTGRPGLLLAIVTADCAPVLLADAQAGVVGAAHAGWRGALGGVIENVVAAMAALGAQPARIRAAIGPCIAQPSYEVDDALRRRFGEAAARFFAPGRAGRWQFDLPGYVAHRLTAAGVGEIDRDPPDTYADPARFHSYRRATHRGEPNAGRQVSVIGLRQCA